MQPATNTPPELKMPSLLQIERELARRKLLDFTCYTFNDAESDTTSNEYLYNWFHELLCSKLDQFLKDVEAQKSPRLMVFAPPRHGKSEIFSRRLPAFAVGKYPHYTFITSSYNSELAEDMCKDVQRIMETDEYQAIFPNVKIKSTLSEVDREKRQPTQNTRKFDIVDKTGRKQGVYNSSGVSSGATGKGAHIFIIDDPVKDEVEATSETSRRRVDAWFKSVALTRLAPGGGCLIIMTRWHDDDLCGRIEKSMADGGEQWDVIKCPAVAEEDEKFRDKGEALHPERYNINRLQKIEREVGPRVWSSLYQQNPIMSRGNLFPRHFFEIVTVITEPIIRSVRYWDRAATLPKGNNPDPDWTAGVRIDKGVSGTLYVIDLKHTRNTPSHIDKLLLSTARSDGKKTRIHMSEDPGQAGKQQTELHQKLLRGYILEFIRETGSKEVRAEGPSVDAENGHIKLLKGVWNETFLSELEGFPFMAHDDIVDSFSGSWFGVTEGTYDLRSIVRTV